MNSLSTLLGGVVIGLHTVTPGNIIQAGDINQCINVLQQPSGGQETGKYFLAGWSNAANDLLSTFVISRSRNATPVSVSVDTSQSLNRVNAPSTNLQTSGFQVWTSATGAGANISCAGNWTVQF